MDHRVKIKKSKKRDMYLNLTRELRMLWNMKVVIIKIVIGGFGRVPEQLGKETRKVGGRDQYS